AFEPVRIHHLTGLAGDLFRAHSLTIFVGANVLAFTPSAIVLVEEIGAEGDSIADGTSQQIDEAQAKRLAGEIEGGDFDGTEGSGHGHSGFTYIRTKVAEDGIDPLSF